MNHIISDNPPTLEKVKKHFEAWRSSRASKREPIQPHLWQAAAGLCGKHSISRVSQQLHLSYSDLKKRIAGAHRSPVQFMEIDLGTVPSQWQIECNRTDGSQLTFSFSAIKGQPPSRCSCTTDKGSGCARNDCQKVVLTGGRTTKGRR